MKTISMFLYKPMVSSLSHGWIWGIRNTGSRELSNFLKSKILRGTVPYWVLNLLIFKSSQNCSYIVFNFVPDGYLVQWYCGTIDYFIIILVSSLFPDTALWSYPLQLDCDWLWNFFGGIYLASVWWIPTARLWFIEIIWVRSICDWRSSSALPCCEEHHFDWLSSIQIYLAPFVMDEAVQLCCGWLSSFERE